MFEGVDSRTVVEWFDLGGSLPLSDSSSADEVIARTRGVQGLRELAAQAGLPGGAAAPAASLKVAGETLSVMLGRPVKFTRDDFIPIARFIADPMVLVVNDKQPWKTLKRWARCSKALT